MEGGHCCLAPKCLVAVFILCNSIYNKLLNQRTFLFTISETISLSFI